MAMHRIYEDDDFSLFQDILSSEIDIDLEFSKLEKSVEVMYACPIPVELDGPPVPDDTISKLTPKKAVKAPRKPRKKKDPGNLIIYRSDSRDGANTAHVETSSSVTRPRKNSASELILISKAKRLVSLLRQICNATNSGDESTLSTLVEKVFEADAVFRYESTELHGIEAIKGHYLQSMWTHPDGLRKYESFLFENQTIVVALSFSGTKHIVASSSVDDLYSHKNFDPTSREQAERILLQGRPYTYSGQATLTFTINDSFTKLTSATCSPWVTTSVVAASP